MICSPQPSDGSAPLEDLADQLAAFIDKVDLKARLITVDWDPDF